MHKKAARFCAYCLRVDDKDRIRNRIGLGRLILLHQVLPEIEPSVRRAANEKAH